TGLDQPQAGLTGRREEVVLPAAATAELGEHLVRGARGYRVDLAAGLLREGVRDRLVRVPLPHDEVELPLALRVHVGALRRTAAAPTAAALAAASTRRYCRAGGQQ